MRFFFTIFLLSLSLIGFTHGLKDYMPKNKFVGTALNNSILEGKANSNYEDIVAKDFNCIVAENAFKMSNIIPSKPLDPFNLTLADFSQQGLRRVDAMLEIAEEQGMKTRGHTLIWHNQAPNWLNSDVKSWSNDQIYDFARSYIQVLTQYTKGKIDEWDVVNEAINDDKNPQFRNDAWFSGVDDIQNFIDYCFTVTHESVPESDLFYNDYNVETSYFPKNTFLLNMVEGMVSRNIPIHGVGLQTHLTSGEYTNENTYKGIGETIDKAGNLGLKCNVTELDIRICGGTTPTKLSEQSHEYLGVFELLLEKDNFQSLIVWGFTDASSWIPSTFDGCDDATLYDRNYTPKKAYEKVFELLVDNYEGPFDFLTHQVPGKIEAEHYNYNNFIDNDLENKGNEFRTDAVDISIGATNYFVSYTEPGEQLNYSINVNYSDNYFISLSYSSESNETIPEVQLSLNGNPLGHSFLLQPFESATSFDSIEQANIFLEKGEHMLTIEFISGGANIDYIQLLRNDCAGVKGGTAAIDECNICSGGTTGLETCENKGPYTAITIPGILEIEDYDKGGQDLGYFDNSMENEGDAYRSDRVDIVSTNDLGGGFALSYIEKGEWLEYTVNVIDTGFYSLKFRIASEMNGGSFNLLLNNINTIEKIDALNTSSWDNYEYITIDSILIDELGKSIIRIEFENGGFNLNHIVFEKMIYREPYALTSLPGILEVENYDIGGEGIAFYDISEGNTGGSYRDDNVDLAGTSDSGGGYVMAWIESGEWTEYSVQINQTAAYKLSFRYATTGNSGKLNVLVNNASVATANFSSTNDWNQFNDLEIRGIELNGGEAIIRLDFENGGFNLNHINFELDDENSVSSLNNRFCVYPNPFNSIIHIKGLEVGESWQMFNIDGKLINQGIQEIIETSDIKPGLYILKTSFKSYRILKLND